jgi:hypothetical protein
MCESATAFCESLWSPYSERFLWRGSVAHHSHRLPRAMSCSSPRRRSKEPGMVMSDVRGSSDWKKKKHHRIAEGLKNHCWKALGLKALLEWKTELNESDFQSKRGFSAFARNLRLSLQPLHDTVKALLALAAFVFWFLLSISMPSNECYILLWLSTPLFISNVFWWIY